MSPFATFCVISEGVESCGERMLVKEDLTYTDENVTSFLWKLHGNGVLSLVFTIIAVYMIVFKSPATMKHYKWFLLNITVSFSNYMRCRGDRLGD